MQNEAEKVDQLTSGRTEGRFMTVRGDPSTIWGFCCGRGLPTVKADDPAHGCFTSCPVWIAEKRRLEERRDLVAPPGRAGGVLAGSSVEVVGGLG